MEVLDPLRGQPQRSHGLGRSRGCALVNLTACKTQTGSREVDAVKTVRVFDQRPVATLRDVLDNRGDEGIDIRCGLSLCVEQFPEICFKPGSAGRQSDWYQSLRWFALPSSSPT